MSSSPNLSPHSGQNLGGFLGSSGIQPHLSHRYWGAPAGFRAPHSEQNFPWFTAPQEQVQPAAGSGFLAPHSGQNLPVTVAPQLHLQPSAGAVCRPIWNSWAALAPPPTSVSIEGQKLFQFFHIAFSSGVALPEKSKEIGSFISSQKFHSMRIEPSGRIIIFFTSSFIS